MLQVIINTPETSEKTENFRKEIEDIKKEPKENFRTEKYNNQAEINH